MVLYQGLAKGVQGIKMVRNRVITLQNTLGNVKSILRGYLLKDYIEESNQYCQLYY